MGIPQIIMLCLFAMDFAINAVRDGERKEGHYSVVAAIIAIVIEFLILRAGGFF